MDKDIDRLSNPEIAKDFPPNNWEEWLKAVEDTLKGVPFDKAMITKTYEGINLKPIYRKEDIKDLPHLNSLPGYPPYVRGNKAEGYVTEGWVIAQQQTEWNPGKLNKILLKELNSGLNAINLKLDSLTRWAITPEKERCCLNGLCLRHLQDLETTLDGVNIQAVPVFVDSGEASLTILGLFAAYCQKHQIPLSDLSGFIGNDYLSILAENGQILASEAQLQQQLVQTCIWANNNAPKLRTILLNGAVWANHGADSLQELAFIIASANEYIKVLLNNGLTIEQIAPRFQVNLCLGSNLFMEISKVRSLRLLWTELLKAYGASEEMQKVWIHGVTSSFNKTLFDPYVNMLRTATESFSGIIGGIDSLDVLPFDIKAKKEDEFSRRIARNQQIILKEETHLDKVIDPAGGCYYIETLTAQLADKAWQLMQEIELQGGMFSCIQEGIVQTMINDKAKERMGNVNKRRDVFVGVNMFANPLEQPLNEKWSNSQAGQNNPCSKLHLPQGECQCELDTFFNELTAFKQSNRPLLSEVLNQVKQNVDKPNIVDYIINAHLSKATLDEVQNHLINDSGCEITAKAQLRACHATKDIEDLRLQILDYQQQNELVLSVFLANMGPIAKHKARADFAMGFLQVGGFYVANNDGFANVAQAADAALFSQAQAVCICSTDDTYPELVPAIIKEIRSKKPDMVFILAGYPDQMVETYKNQGIDLFIHLRANAFDVLKDLATKLGVTL